MVFSKNKISNKKILLLLFILSFSYIFFFTQCVPFFFDDHEFHADYVKADYKEHFRDLVRLGADSIATGPRPVYGFYAKALFPLLGYDYCGYRIAKALIFSLLISAFYLLLLQLFKRKTIALITTVYFMTTFPLFLQTFGYNGPHIFAELFKIAAIILFVKDITCEKTSIMRQGLVFMFALLAIRSYSPAYALAVILPFFTLFYVLFVASAKQQRWQSLLNYGKRYGILFVCIMMIQFPVTLVDNIASGNFLGGISTKTYTPKLVNIKHVFLNDLKESIFNLKPSYISLYYKSFSAIVTFFGFWLIVISSVFLCFKQLKKKISTKSSVALSTTMNTKLIFILALVWLFCEIPNYIFLPEHAIRYIMAFFVPFTILCTLLIVKYLENVKENYKHYASIVIIAMLAGAMLTNISFVYAFRAGWGSSFIGFEKVMDYFAENHDSNTKVLSYTNAVATEYKYINKSRTDSYQFGGASLEYNFSGNYNDFSEERIKEQAKNYSELYVLKRTTSISKVSYPYVTLEAYPSLTLVAIFDGYDEKTLFDRINKWLMSTMHISYQPNRIFVYEYKKDKETLNTSQI